MADYENYKKDAIRYLRNYKGVGHSAYYCVNGTTTKTLSTSCYMMLWSHLNTKTKFLAVGYYTKKDNPVGVSFLNWILDKERSPWRKLFKGDFELIESEDAIHGIIVPLKTVHEAPIKFLKNFLIAARNFNEFEENINFWYKCVSEENIPEERAYIYCRHFQHYTGEDDFWVRPPSNTNHWPVVHAPDWDRFISGEPDLNTNYTNTLFSKEYNKEFTNEDVSYGGVGYSFQSEGYKISSYPTKKRDGIVRLDRNDLRRMEAELKHKFPTNRG